MGVQWTGKMGILSIFTEIDAFQRLQMHISISAHPGTSNFISAYSKTPHQRPPRGRPPRLKSHFFWHRFIFFVNFM